MLWTSHSRTVSSCDPERSSVPSMDTDRQVTMFLRKRRRKRVGSDITHLVQVGGGEAGLHSPVTFEHLVPVAVRLERLVPTETLRTKSRTVPTEPQIGGGRE